jgi:ribosomal protein S18 acetylase RimI-like enzyme
LLRRSLDAFARAGCKAASLTVTESNAVAVRLYKRNGFRSIASFPAFAWQRR